MAIIDTTGQTFNWRLGSPNVSRVEYDNGKFYLRNNNVRYSISPSQALAADPSAKSQYPAAFAAAEQKAAASGPSLSEQMNNAQNEAKAANESRYNEIKAGYESRYARNMADIANVGSQQNADIKSEYQKRMAATNQNLAARGLSGTTIAPTMALGNTREMNADLARSNEQLAKMRTGLDSQLSGDTLQFMERREDTYPDMQQYLAVQQGLGQGSTMPRSIGQVTTTKTVNGVPVSNQTAAMPTSSTYRTTTSSAPKMTKTSLQGYVPPVKPASSAPIQTASQKASSLAAYKAALAKLSGPQQGGLALPVKAYSAPSASQQYFYNGLNLSTAYPRTY